MDNYTLIKKQKKELPSFLQQYIHEDYDLYQILYLCKNKMDEYTYEGGYIRFAHVLPQENKERIEINSLYLSNQVIGKNVNIKPNVIVRQGVILEDYVTLEEGVLIDEDVIIHDNAKIGKKTTIYRGCKIGSFSTVPANLIVSSGTILKGAIFHKED